MKSTTTTKSASKTSTKATTAKPASEVIEETGFVVEDTKSAVASPVKNAGEADDGVSKEQLLEIVKNLMIQVEELKQEKNMNTSQDTGNIDRLISAITNRRSEKEITIVHNQELSNGLKTHIDLSTLTIDFGKLGEQRLLTLSQFEECASKYRSFFDRKIILVAAENRADAEKYGLPCADREDGKTTISREELYNVGNYSAVELEAYIRTLCDEDVDMLCAYWLGKCYEKEKDPRFYDRYKMDVLNRITNGSFTNIIMLKNEEEIRAVGR